MSMQRISTVIIALMMLVALPGLQGVGDDGGKEGQSATGTAPEWGCGAGGDKRNITDNDPPYVVEEAPAKFTIAEDGAPGYLFMHYIFADPDLDPLSYTVLDGAFGPGYNDKLIQADIMTNNDTLRVQSHQNKNGQVVITLKATDINFTSVEYDITIVVRPTNDPPVFKTIGGEPVTPGEIFKIDVNEDEEVSLEVVAKDIDGDVLTFDDECKLFKIQATGDLTALISFTPDNEDVGDYTFEITVEDDKKEDALEVELTVHNTNDPPVWTKLTGDTVRDGVEYKLTMDQSTWLNATTKASDDDKQNTDERLTYSHDLDLPDFIDPETGDISFFATNDHVGSHSGHLVVSDRAGETDTLAIRVVVADVNDPPSDPVIDSPENNENIDMGPKGVRFTAGIVTDPDVGDEVQYMWDFGDGGTAGGKTAKHVYDYSGMFNITLSVTDGKVQRPVSTTIRIYVERNETMWDNDGDTIPDNQDDDDDNDGIPDDWENAYPRYDLDPMNASDAQADNDGDGYTNLQEYEAGTDLNNIKAYPGSDEKGDDGGGAGGDAWAYALAAVIAVMVALLIVGIFVSRARKKKAREEEEASTARTVADRDRDTLDEIRKLYGTGPGAPGPAGGAAEAVGPGSPAQGATLPQGAYRPGVLTYGRPGPGATGHGRLGPGGPHPGVPHPGGPGPGGPGPRRPGPGGPGGH